MAQNAVLAFLASLKAKFCMLCRHNEQMAPRFMMREGNKSPCPKCGMTGRQRIQMGRRINRHTKKGGRRVRSALRNVPPAQA